MSNLREAAQQALETLTIARERGLLFGTGVDKRISNLEAALAQSDDKPVEAWHGDRKVTVYADTVLRSWGPNIETQMSTAPRTAQEVQDAFVWLYADDKAQVELVCYVDRKAGTFQIQSNWKLLVEGKIADSDPVSAVNARAAAIRGMGKTVSVEVYE